MELKDEVRSLRESTGMSRQEFAGYFEIPYRTLQDWELGNRRIPEYLLRLMEYKTRLEGLCDKNDTTDRKAARAAEEPSGNKLSHTAYLSNIDLEPVLDHLLINKDEFLRPIHNVEVSYD